LSQFPGLFPAPCTLADRDLAPGRFGVGLANEPAREEMQPVPQPKDAAKGHKPFAHPHYWAAFILIGDPD
jgi:CHAT domain-containing protein